MEPLNWTYWFSRMWKNKCSQWWRVEEFQVTLDKHMLMQLEVKDCNVLCPSILQLKFFTFLFKQ